MQETFAMLIIISSTLVVRGLNHMDHTPAMIRDYFRAMHPNITIR